MEACSSVTSVDFQRTTWRYIPENRTLQRRELLFVLLLEVLKLCNLSIRRYYLDLPFLLQMYLDSRLSFLSESLDLRDLLFSMSARQLKTILPLISP
jgi:hypothetical protein